MCVLFFLSSFSFNYFFILFLYFQKDGTFKNLIEDLLIRKITFVVILLTTKQHKNQVFSLLSTIKNQKKKMLRRFIITLHQKKPQTFLSFPFLQIRFCYSTPQDKFFNLCERFADQSNLIEINPLMRKDFVQNIIKMVVDQKALWEGQEETKQQTVLISMPPLGTFDIICSFGYRSKSLRKDLEVAIPQIFAPSSMNQEIVMDQCLSPNHKEICQEFSMEALVCVSELLVAVNRKQQQQSSNETQILERNRLVKLFLTKAVDRAKFSPFSSLSEKIDLLVRICLCASKIAVRSSTDLADISFQIVQNTLKEIEISLQKQVKPFGASIIPDTSSSSSATASNLSVSKYYQLPSRQALLLFDVIGRTKMCQFPDFTRKLCENATRCVKFQNDVGLVVDALKACVSLWMYHHSFFPAVLQRLTILAPNFTARNLYDVCLCLNLLSRRDPKTRSLAELGKFGPQLRAFAKAIEKRAQEVSLSPRQAKMVVVALTKSGAKCTRNVLEATVS